jgi:hypothetical protein
MSAARGTFTAAIVRQGCRRERPRRFSRCRWHGLTAADGRLLIAVALAQVVAAAALRAMGLPVLRAGARRYRQIARFLVSGSDERIAWAIEATGRRLGRLSSCLIRALVAELVLDVGDGPVSLTIGVRRTSAGTLEAHAWLARQDRVLVGATSVEYAPLVTWTSLPV